MPKEIEQEIIVPDVPKVDVVAWTGHRPVELGGSYDENNPTAAWVKKAIAAVVDSLGKGGVKEWVSGMAQGVDTWAAEEVLAQGGRLVAAVPCLGQEQGWPRHSQQRYHKILSECAEVVTVTREPYFAGVMHVRNSWMLARAGLVVAVWYPKRREGGTWHMVKSALAAGKPVLHIDPEKRTVQLMAQVGVQKKLGE